MDVGIDLGTTFSVVTVKGRVQLADGYPQGQYLEECDVTVIPSPAGDPEVASVFWANPGNPEEVLIGDEAKGKAQEGESPIMFSKRSIGTDEPLKIGGRIYSAKDVATQILKYLKGFAEQALGQPVHRAVITHPAYFDLNQVNETKEAAEAAGFDMSLPEQLMMEPAAAALAYLRSENKDPMRVMTYDLGGGTFDVTVLERREGLITLKAFDGDHLLGGYNFDRELVQWILSRLKGAGRVIPYDDANPADHSRRARLLQLAEKIKIQLGEQRTAKVPVQIRALDILVDSEGRNVQILESITREQYAALIKDHLDKTIACCRSALDKAGMQIGDLDAILLVGGSTLGKWVHETLAQAFQIDVNQFNPALCVAAGAALRAADLPPEASGNGLKLILDIPATSALSTINVAGHLLAGNGEPLEEGLRKELTILLRTPAGELAPLSLGPDAQFLFADVELLEDEPTELSVQIVDGKGLDRLSKSISIRYSPDDAGITNISTSLPKPIYLEAGTGKRLIAEEGAQLPVKCEIVGRMLFKGGEFDVAVYQEDIKIGTIFVDNIPPDADEGSPVVISVEITEKNEMRGDAKVLQRPGGPVLAQCPVRIKFPPIVLPDLPELHKQFEDLESDRVERLALSNDPEQRLALDGEGRKLSKRLHKLFEEQAPDKQEIYRALKELNRLVNPPSDDMEPPRAQFRRLMDDARDMLSENTDPQLDPFKPALARIEADGNDAYTTKNHKKWATTNESLAALHSRIRKVTSGDGGGDEQELPPTEILKDSFRQLVDALRVDLNRKRDEMEPIPKYATKFKPRVDAIETELDKMEINIDKVDNKLPPRQALGQLQLATRDKDKIKLRIPKLNLDFEGGEPSIAPALRVQAAQLRAGTEVPTSRIDKVHFSVSSPPAIKRGEAIIVDVWAHLEWQRAEVERRVEQAKPPTDPSPIIRPKGPFKIERGTSLFVRLKFEDLHVEPPEDVIGWEGQIGNATFTVTAPAEIGEGLKTGSAIVYWDGGLQIARLAFQIHVVTDFVSMPSAAHEMQRIQKAFASYASSDRDEVLARIQGMQKILPDIDVFLDVVKLRSGDDWERKLFSLIPANDIFYLFWSAAAKASPWVDKEWRCALKIRGYEFIDPVPLVSPEEVPPPEELSKKYFNDWTLAYRRGKADNALAS